MKTVRVAAAVIQDGEKILATQRGYGEYKGGWEFPGGKIEPEESPEEALKREIMEELETEICVGELIDTVEYDYPDFHLSMDCFWCHISEGVPVLKEHEDAKWLDMDSLYSVDWLPADVTILEKIISENYAYFKAEIKKRTGILLDLYKENQMKRRINTLISRKGIKGYKEYLKVLDRDQHELSEFKDYITINVTEFFRTPEHWKYFENKVLQELLQRSNEKKIRIWSCACSTGEEPYSIAMSLMNIADLSNFEIIASDIDDKVLKAAQEGIYDEKIVSNIPEDLRDRVFVKNPHGWQVKDEIRSAITFKKLDLLQDEYISDCDVIVCRNVLIYFTEKAKDTIYAKFLKCLNPKGYLFTGNTEQLIYYKQFGYNKICNYIYTKN